MLVAFVLFSSLAVVATATPIPVKNWNTGSKSASGIPKDPQTNTTKIEPYPTYKAVTDFDVASLVVANYQEFAELDLFEQGYNQFSDQDFANAGLTADDRQLVQFMAQQEVGHAQLVNNMLPPKYQVERCTYNWTKGYTNLRDYFEFNERLTRWGESGVVGFLTQLNSRPVAHNLQSSIHTEARQQMAFRQFAGSQAMGYKYFIEGIPQAWAWTLLAPYITSCPANQTRVSFSNYPALDISPDPDAGNGGNGAINTNTDTKLAANQTITLTWEQPGQRVGPNSSYTTTNSGKTPTYALFVSQLNATKVELQNVTENSATVTVPSGNVLPQLDYDSGQGSSFVAVTDEGTGHYTPYNLSLVTKHMIAGPRVVVLS